MGVYQIQNAAELLYISCPAVSIVTAGNVV